MKMTPGVHFLVEDDAKKFAMSYLQNYPETIILHPPTEIDMKAGSDNDELGHESKFGSLHTKPDPKP